ncbi:unnamed protein product [Oppiella nova]|uniref:Alcohol dehydrogenase-like N-terminal domain-containing protein n=1 Tax=Oppiella nova TaxID=334625 RepID=A0A7R9LU62_9ACAR|nr:unnamed protein product [Oppiella nova]CAG2167040.1 unnamed protein product [Oppiella nova]
MFGRKLITYLSVINKITKLPKVCVNAYAIRRMSANSHYKQIQVLNYSTNFAEATKIVSLPLVDPKSDEILVKNLFVGINATDLNITAGRYFKHSDPPYPLGFEALGQIVKTGSAIKDYSVGQYLVVMCGSGRLKGYSEYLVITAN